MTTLAAALANWATNISLDDVSEDVVLETKKALLNSLGTGLGAFELDDVQRALSIVKRDGESGRSTVFVDGAHLPTMSALFVNGVMFNTLGQEETHSFSGTHPAETTIPVVLAIAELRRIDGRRALEAMLIGIEATMAFASMELTPPVKYDNCEAPAAYGTIGAAAAAGFALGLDEESLGHAIALGANFAGGLSECVRVGTSEYHYSVANASTHGYLAALLAEAGKKAATTSLEGAAGFYQLFGAVPRDALAQHPVVDDVMGWLSSRWGVKELIYKPYPVHFFNQTFVDGARELREENALDPGTIDAIRLTINPLAYASGGPNKGPFDSRESVLGSTAFCVAAMLTRVRVGLSETLDFDDPAIGHLVDRTTVTGSDDMNAAQIEIDADGKTVLWDGQESGRDYRLAYEEISAIFHDVLLGILPPAQTEAIETMVLALLDQEDASKLVELLSRNNEAYRAEASKAGA
jgi:2-methylcitrate dehydratase PrpD